MGTASRRRDEVVRVYEEGESAGSVYQLLHLSFFGRIGIDHPPPRGSFYAPEDTKAGSLHPAFARRKKPSLE